MTTPAYIERLLNNRQNTAAKLVQTTDLGAAWRASWYETRLVGGSGGGWSRDKEIVKWVAVDPAGNFLGAWDFRKYALDEIGAK